MRLIDADRLLEVYDQIHIGPPGNARIMIATAPTVEIPGWISAKDRLPEPPCKCLAYTPYNKYGDGMITATFTEFGWMTPGYIGQITHWMPLPKPPDDVPNGFRIGGVMEVAADMLEEGGGGDAAD